MDSPTGHELNADRSPTGTAPPASAGLNRQAAQDILFGPGADILIDRAKPVAGERVIDIGCGSGLTTIAFARKVAPSGHASGARRAKAVAP